MELYLKSKQNNYAAKGEYDPDTKIFILKSGSTVSEKVSCSEVFKGATVVDELRKRYVVSNVLQEDLTFKSASTAANFVTGRSTNGMLAWRTNTGETLKIVLFKRSKK